MERKRSLPPLVERASPSSGRALVACPCDPVLLGELEGVAEAKRHDSFSSLHPLVRRLTGSEKMHLASGRASGTKLARRAEWKEHGDPGLSGLAGLYAFR